MRRLTAAAVGLVGAGLVLLPPAPSYADTLPCSEIQQTTPVTPSDPVTRASAPMTLLGIPQFQKLIRAEHGEPGAGIAVAVVDSGIYPGPGLAVGGRLRVAPALPSATYYHGTAVAGLIAGRSDDPAKPVGVAPGASLVDVHFYDIENSTDTTTTDQGAPLDADTLATALQAVSTAVEKYPQIRIVNVSVATKSSPRLKAAVQRLTAQHVVVVASSGNRPTEPGEYPPGYLTAKYGEDAAGAVFPAGYAVSNPLVVAVGSTVEGDGATDPLSKLLANSAIDVVAPSINGVSYGLNGVTCTLPSDPYTSFSTAEVSGVLAALMSVFDKETSQEVVSRLEATATGQLGGADLPPDRYTGRGVIQPIEALQRNLQFDAQGQVVGASLPVDAVEPAALPRPEPDVLRSTRHHALWWGLAGGGALLVAVTLRPVLARRRR